MKKGDPRYGAYLGILREELVPAMGCTEPIAIAYAAALARHTLGRLPDRCTVRVSGNIIKNVKSVIVPNTGGLRGIEAACAAGLTVGDAQARLQVLSAVSEEDKPAIAAYLAQHVVEVIPAGNDKVFYIEILAQAGEETARTVLEDSHTNLTCLEHNGVPVPYHNRCREQSVETKTDRSLLSVEGIVDFADSVDLDDVRDCIERQIEYNMAIAQEGLHGSYGAHIGQVLLESRADSLDTRIRAYAAAGSDARMSGCELPVIIVSGSGNQGLTASVPVIVYARERSASHEELLRALVLSNLTTIHQKTEIGALSAFCGAVSAGCGAAAGIAYLDGGGYDAVAHTVVNTLAIVSGMVCDGAKPSCAAKISAAVDAGLMGYEMYRKGQQFYGGDGILKKGVENTIRTVGRVAKEGMKQTDEEIISIMAEKN